MTAPESVTFKGHKIEFESYVPHVPSEAEQKAYWRAVIALRKRLHGENPR